MQAWPDRALEPLSKKKTTYTEYNVETPCNVKKDWNTEKCAL